jgi:hypothetical protein
MTFEWLDRRTVKSDQGFTYHVFGVFKHKYHEGDRTLVLTGEPLVGRKWGFVVYTDLAKARWEPPYENEAISREHADRIRENVLSAAEFMNGRVEFHH